MREVLVEVQEEDVLVVSQFDFVSLHFKYYNFARIHQTLKVTPAMEAGISDHVWSIEEIARLMES